MDTSWITFGPEIKLTTVNILFFKILPSFADFGCQLLHTFLKPCYSDSIQTTLPTLNIKQASAYTVSPSEPEKDPNNALHIVVRETLEKVWKSLNELRKNFRTKVRNRRFAIKFQIMPQ